MYSIVSLVFLFMHIFLSDCSLQGKPKNLTLAKAIEERLNLCNVQILKDIWSDHYTVMNNCDFVQLSEDLSDPYIANFRFDEYLCMALYDASYQLCDIIMHNKTLNEISVTPEKILGVPSTDTFCDDMSKSLLNPSFSVHQDWIKNFNDIMKNKTQCMKMCTGIRRDIMNPLCVFVLWIDNTVMKLKDSTQLSNVKQSDVQNGGFGNRKHQTKARYKEGKGQGKTPESDTDLKISPPEKRLPSSKSGVGRGAGPFESGPGHPYSENTPGLQNSSARKNAHDVVGTNRQYSTDRPTTTLQQEANNEKPMLDSTLPSPGSLDKNTSEGEIQRQEQNTAAAAESGKRLPGVSAIPSESMAELGGETGQKFAQDQTEQQPEGTPQLTPQHTPQLTPQHTPQLTPQLNPQLTPQLVSQKVQQEQGEEQEKKVESSGGAVVAEAGGEVLEPVLEDEATNGVQNPVVDGEGEDDDDDDDGMELDVPEKKNTVPPNFDYADLKKITNAGIGEVVNNIQDPHTDPERIMQTERDSIGVYGHDNRFDAEETHFFAYFMTMIILCILGYLIFHNKQKILALALEGRARRGGRRRPNTSGYRKLDSNLEEAVTSGCSGTSVTHVIY